MRTLVALVVIASVTGCAVAFDLDPVKQAQRERLLQPEIVRVPTGFKETWSPPPITRDHGPRGLADARLPFEKLLPSSLRGRAATEEPEAPGARSSGETPATARREPTPRELDAVERALDEVRGLALPRIELPPPGPAGPAPPKERTGP